MFYLLDFFLTKLVFFRDGVYDPNMLRTKVKKSIKKMTSVVPQSLRQAFFVHDSLGHFDYGPTYKSAFIYG